VRCVKVGADMRARPEQSTVTPAQQQQVVQGSASSTAALARIRL